MTIKFITLLRSSVRNSNRDRSFRTHLYVFEFDWKVRLTKRLLVLLQIEGLTWKRNSKLVEHKCLSRLGIVWKWKCSIKPSIQNNVDIFQFEIEFQHVLSTLLFVCHFLKSHLKNDRRHVIKNQMHTWIRCCVFRLCAKRIWRNRFRAFIALTPCNSFSLSIEECDSCKWFDCVSVCQCTICSSSVSFNLFVLRTLIIAFFEWIYDFFFIQIILLIQLLRKIRIGIWEMIFCDERHILRIELHWIDANWFSCVLCKWKFSFGLFRWRKKWTETKKNFRHIPRSI